MAQHDPKVIRSNFRGGVRTYYSYDDELYAGTFPEEWAHDHAPETGPKDCENCRDHGFWNGVFMLYCANCAIHVYKGTRGKGASGPGEEFDIPKNRGFDSAFDTYLYNVNLHDVGDTDFHDSIAEIVNRYASEFIHRNPRDVLAAFARMNDELRGNGDGDGEREEYVEYRIDTNSFTEVSEFGRSPTLTFGSRLALNGTHEHMTDHNEERMGYDYDIAAATADAAYDDADYPDQNEHVAEAGPSAFDWDESGRRRFYRMGYDEYRMDYDSDDDANEYDVDDDDEYDRRRNCHDSRTVCYDSDNEHTRHRYQQYIPSKDECVLNPLTPENERERYTYTESEPEQPSSPPTSSGQNVRQDSVYQHNGPHTATSEDDFDYFWNSGQSVEQYRRDQGIKYYGGYEEAHSLNTQESVPEPDMPFEPETETESCVFSEREPELDEAVHCMICENTKFTCACDEDLIHQSVFCYTCENPRYICNCSEESRNQTHYCLHCTKVKYQCICVGENSVYLRVARKYCIQQCSVPDDEEEI